MVWGAGILRYQTEVPLSGFGECGSLKFAPQIEMIGWFSVREGPDLCKTGSQGTLRSEEISIPYDALNEWFGNTVGLSKSFK
jgi:hypothetical protein